MRLHRILSVALGLLFLPGFGRAQEFPKPGPEHEHLKAMAGEWDAEVKFYAKPGEAPIESKGQYSGKLDVGGFFLITDFKGSPVGGEKFHGRGLTGYDPFKKKYTGVWVDSMSPAMYTTEGEFDKQGKVYTETMQGPGPDGKVVKMRLTTEIKDKDHMVFKMYSPAEDGKEKLTMEISYARKK